MEGADLWADTAPSPKMPIRASSPRNHTCFGRVSPQQKRQLIQGLRAKERAHGHHDRRRRERRAGPQDADCSVAMAAGSETAQQVAQIVLLDSDFSAMPHIVAEGRRVWGNIQRAASLFLVKNIFSFLAVCFCSGCPLPTPLPPHPDQPVRGFDDRRALVPAHLRALL